MKKTMMVALLGAVCACAGLSRTGNDALSGTWRGVVRKGALESVVLFQFSRMESGYQGNYWGTPPLSTPIPLARVELGHSVLFEVPQVGVFHGELAGETMQGTFEDAQGPGSFYLQKQPPLEEAALGE